MAVNLANAAGANIEFLDIFQQARPVAARGQAPRAILARNDSSVPTINMFIDGESPSMKWVASIVNACGGETTLALRCTAGPSCGPNNMTRNYDVKATVIEQCALQGTTAAVCGATIGGTVDNKSTTTSTVTTLSGSAYHRYDVTITGGAEKTADPSAECKSGASTKTVAMWGLLGAAGIVALLVGF
ncbi:hypothetical protein N0V88_007834 [Collariella sp. IMI 366227]|nr:hypothetical protein N0V88_007834 [Collariella sp. IMI 366227]